MQINVLNTVKNTKTVVALGKFDGLHIAHRALIKQCVQISQNKGFDCCVYFITGASRTLCNSEYTQVLLKKMGVSKMCEDVMTPEYMSMMPAQFVSDILFKKLNCAHVVVGYNYRFGKNRAGDVNTLKEECAKFGICVTVIKQVCMEIAGKQVEVSSTNIKECMKSGNISDANKMLGRLYRISGQVEHGKRLGKKIGFPTANVHPEFYVSPLKLGVYATKTTVDGTTYNSVTNVGVNPTLDNYENVLIETHIFDFDIDIYGKDIIVEFVDFIRPETKFENAQTLKMQLEKDALKAKKILEK